MIFWILKPVNWDLVCFLGPLGSFIQIVASSSVLRVIANDFVIRVEGAVVLFMSTDEAESSAIKILVAERFACFTVREVMSVTHLSRIFGITYNTVAIHHLPVGVFH